MPKAGGVPRPAVAYHSMTNTTSGQQADPLMQQCACPVRTARQQGLAHIRARPEQDHQSQLSGPGSMAMLGDELCRC